MTDPRVELKARIEAAARALWKMGNARIGERPWGSVAAHYVAEATVALEAADHHAPVSAGVSPVLPQLREMPTLMLWQRCYLLILELGKAMAREIRRLEEEVHPPFGVRALPEAKEAEPYINEVTRRLAALAEPLPPSPKPLDVKWAAMRALKWNWNSYGGRPISEAAIKAAQRFLGTLSVVPRSGGGVALEWHREGVDVEVVFEEDGTIEPDERVQALSTPALPPSPVSADYVHVEGTPPNPPTTLTVGGTGDAAGVGFVDLGKDGTVPSVPSPSPNGLRELIAEWRNAGVRRLSECADQLEAALAASPAPRVGRRNHDHDQTVLCRVGCPAFADLPPYSPPA